MGASLVYLDKPNKDIQFEEGENDFLRYTAASMQGWRINMVSTFSLHSSYAFLKRYSYFIVDQVPLFLAKSKFKKLKNGIYLEEINLTITNKIFLHSILIHYSL